MECVDFLILTGATKVREQRRKKFWVYPQEVATTTGFIYWRQKITKIYVSVGSASNVGEYGMDKKWDDAMHSGEIPSRWRKTIRQRIAKSCKMSWNPVTGELDCRNERDEQE
jgi:glucose/arabinose dehydrogenase